MTEQGDPQQTSSPRRVRRFQPALLGVAASDKPSSCPGCGKELLVVAGKLPLEKAIDLANPFTRLKCLDCERAYWAWKPKLHVVAAAVVVIAVVAFAANLVIQSVLFGVGYHYGLVDRAGLFTAPPQQIRCPHCGSAKISRSSLQPLERIATPFNPMRPYRCANCLDRFWIIAPQQGIALAIASCLVALGLVVFIWVSYRRRKMKVRSWLGRAGNDETQDWFRISDSDDDA